MYETRPNYRSRRVRLALRNAGRSAGIGRIQILMRERRSSPLDTKPRVDVPRNVYETFPYLFCGHAIEASNDYGGQ